MRHLVHFLSRHNNHWVKGVSIRSYSGPYFEISSYSVGIRKNTDQNKYEYKHFLRSESCSVSLVVERSYAKMRKNLQILISGTFLSTSNTWNASPIFLSFHKSSIAKLFKVLKNKLRTIFWCFVSNNCRAYWIMEPYKFYCPEIRINDHCFP